MVILKLILLSLIILIFGIYTYRVGIKAGGYIPFFKDVLSRGPSRQVTLDLYISLTLISIWLYFDAAQIGIKFLWVMVYWLITLLLGSLGPLLYLFHRNLVQL